MRKEHRAPGPPHQGGRGGTTTEPAQTIAEGARRRRNTMATRRRGPPPSTPRTVARRSTYPRRGAATGTAPHAARPRRRWHHTHQTAAIRPSSQPRRHHRPAAHATRRPTSVPRSSSTSRRHRLGRARHPPARPIYPDTAVAHRRAVRAPPARPAGRWAGPRRRAQAHLRRAARHTHRGRRPRPHAMSVASRGGHDRGGGGVRGCGGQAEAVATLRAGAPRGRALKRSHGWSDRRRGWCLAGGGGSGRASPEGFQVRPVWLDLEGLGRTRCRLRRVALSAVATMDELAALAPARRARTGCDGSSRADVETTTTENNDGDQKTAVQCGSS